MSPLLKVLLWLALPVAVCVWAVAHGQPAEILAGCDPGTVRSDAQGHVYCIARAEPARPNVPGAVLTDDVRKICRRGYSASVRPPESVTEPYKMTLLRRLPPSVSHDPRAWILDDKVPLEVGGGPGPKNWWLQPVAEAHAKDLEENAARERVCDAYHRQDPRAHELLLDAQRYFLNWPDATLE